MQMKRRKVEEEEASEKEVASPIDLIRASLEKRETTLDDWKSAIQAIEEEEGLLAARGELSEGLPRLFMGTPLEDLATSPGKFTLAGLEKTEAEGRRVSTEINGSFTLSLGVDEEQKALNAKEKKEKTKEGDNQEKEGELSFSFRIYFDNQGVDFALHVSHGGETKTLSHCSSASRSFPYDFMQNPVVDVSEGDEFIKFLKSQAIRLPSAPAKDEKSVLHCLIWLLNYAIATCINDDHLELEDEWLAQQLQKL